MFYITVSPGLLEAKHQQKMRVNQKTSAIWVYLWLLDKMTRIDMATGEGAVLGGKPIRIEHDLTSFGDRKTVMKILARLESEGYIRTVRTPYGKSIWVLKAKKAFGWRSPKSGTSGKESGTSLGENLVHLGSESGTSNKDINNKTIQLDKRTKKPIDPNRLKSIKRDLLARGVLQA